MCGRFTLTTPSAELADAFPEFDLPEAVTTRFNISPGQEVLAILNTGDRASCAWLEWGLVPHWARDARIGRKMINARSETLTQKPAFRVPFRMRRCLILADGFYEWKKEAGSARKNPYYVRLAGGRPFAMAGLWDVWRQSPDRMVRSCAVITTEANILVRRIHDRMPVILKPEDYGLWLAPSKPLGPDEAGNVFTPFRADSMEAWPVSDRVNVPGHDGPECIRPLGDF